MIKKLTLLFMALVATGLTAKAQLCGFDQKHQQMLASDPGYAQRTANFNAAWSTGQYQMPNGLIVNTSQGPVYEIPVVIHVIHTGGAIGSIYNPTDAQLTGMITYLNASYASTYAAYPDSLSGGTHFPVRFALAQRGPNCAATTGINRVNGSAVANYTSGGIRSSSSIGADEATVKALSKWDHHDYYNIWVVNKIDGMDGTSGTFTAGYAYFPGAGADVDGTIMLATTATAGEITLPHEIGHAFSLYHVFQGDGGGSVCPTNGNCLTDGDLICDTEPEKRSVFNCPVDPNPCTGLSFNFTQHNFMDYSNCQDRFTKNQRTRWLASMLADRASLISSLGATAPNTQVVTATTCIPPSITNAGNTLNVGPREVKLNDMTATSEGGYTADGNIYYLDKACIQRANLLAGQSYTLSVRTGGAPEKVRIWIDYNNDGTFSAGELVYSHNGTVANELHSTSYLVPTTGVVNCVPLRMRVVSDLTSAADPTACGSLTNGQAEDYSVFITGPSNTATVSIALTSGTNPSCTNSSLTFTATPAGSASVTYKWYLNGAAIAGATASTYTSTTLANGNIITARVFYTGPCGADSSLSNAITVLRASTLTPSVTATITAGSNPGCVGQSITFTATPTNGGTAPVYTWQTYNGVTYTTVAGNTTNTYTTSTLPCGNGVRVILTSNLSCASPTTATSTTTTYNCSPVTSTAVIAQTGGTNPTCAGKPVTFTSTVTNPGPTPTYSWLINGLATGQSGTTFTTTTLHTGDTVQLLFITSNPCVADPVILSNKIVITVIPIDTPKISITITAGSNPGCADSLLEFTAIATSNGGNNSYAWFVNNTRVGTGPVYGSPAFADGDRVFVRVLAGPGCHVRDTTFSDTITVLRYATPPTPVISFIGNLLVSSMPGVSWYGPNNNTLAATGSSYHPSAPGNYYARAFNNGCPSLPSNVLQVSLLKIGTLNMDGLQIYPNPTNGLLNFNWTAPADVRITLYTPTGQAVLHDEVKHASHKTIDLSAFASGIYFVTLQDNQGKTGTVRITLTK